MFCVSIGIKAVPYASTSIEPILPFAFLDIEAVSNLILKT